MAKTLKPPYTAANDIDVFFERVRTIGEPKVPVTSDWITSFNLANSQPQGIMSMLKWLNIVGPKGESTGNWNKVRVPADREEELSKLVRAAYSGIFEAVDVSEATRADLEGAFISVYDAGDTGRLVNCILALCRHAGIQTSVATRGLARTTTVSSTSAERGGRNGAAGEDTTASGEQTERKLRTPEKQVRVATGDGGVSVSLNVEIPADWSDDQVRARIATVMKALNSTTGDS